jgi:hypothetical protein
LLARYRDRFHVRHYHYRLMSNHFHLLLQLPEPRTLSRLVADCWWPTGTTTGGATAWWGTCSRAASRAPRWRQKNICSVVGAKWNAMPSRPVWSRSRGVIAGPAVRPMPMRGARRTRFWRSTLGTSNCPRSRYAGQALWRDFVQGQDPKEHVVRRQDWVIGSATFRTRLQHREARPAPRSRGRPIQPENASCAEAGRIILEA